MDPRGIVQDVHTQGITYDHSSGMLSPDKCAELVSALHTDAPKGKGFYNANLTQKIQMNAHLIYIQFGFIPITHWPTEIHKYFRIVCFFRIQVLNSLQRDVNDPKNGLLMKHLDRPAIQLPHHIRLDQRKFTTLINSIKAATIRLIIRYKLKIPYKKNCSQSSEWNWIFFN